jgi:O-antigen ligase
LWSDGLFIFRQSPLFGIGAENYRQFSSHVAHNSFIHCYAELGMFGGTLFLGAFYLAIKGLYDLRRQPNDATESEDVDPELRRLHPFLMATVVAYTIGICFLSRSYIVPTYMMLGLAVAYMRMHSAQVSKPIAAWSRSVWPRLAGISCSFLVGAYVFVRVFVHWH